MRGVSPVGYKYGPQLKELEHRSQDASTDQPERAMAVVTPLIWARWEELLEDHLDKWWGGYRVRGIMEGFRVGFSGGLDRLKSSLRNMQSAGVQPQVVKDSLDKEVASGRVWEVGSVEAAATVGVHCSPFGVIPKHGKTGKWRLIVGSISTGGPQCE